MIDQETLQQLRSLLSQEELATAKAEFEQRTVALSPSDKEAFIRGMVSAFEKIRTTTDSFSVSVAGWIVAAHE